jgi:hypothetical protein
MMPENSATEVRIKDKAFDAAIELLIRHIKMLLPHGCASCARDAGFAAVSNATESSAGGVLSKEQPLAAAKELLNRHLDQLLRVGYIKNDNDQEYTSIHADLIIYIYCCLLPSCA